MDPNFEFVRRLRVVSDRDVTRLQTYFLDTAQEFAASDLGDRLLFPLEMTWFYGEPVYEGMSEEGKRKLNHLTFCQNYLATLVGESASNILNYEAATSTLIKGDPEVAFYMAREVIEETFHLEAFCIILRKVLAHYGISFEECRAKNHSLFMAVAYARFHQIVGWARGRFDFYYLTRYPLNVSQKTIERSTIKEPRIHPAAYTVLKNHSIDEARHMQMSRETGKRVLANMTPLARAIACVGYAHYAASINMGGRHPKGGILNRATRISVLEMCGVAPADARRAYKEWRDRVHCPEDPPLVRAARSYYLRLNCEYIDELDISPRLRAYMKRTIERAYPDVAATRQAVPIRELEFEELTRAR